MFFSHGSSHSRGVLVLVRDNLDFQLRSIKVDSQGRYVFLEVSIQDAPYFLLNIYAPNKCSEQCTFFKDISEILKAARTEQDYPVIVRGDFNVILDPDLDGRDGNNRKKDSALLVEDMHLDFDLVDIWRIRNPTTSRSSGCAEAFRFLAYKGPVIIYHLGGGVGRFWGGSLDF